MKQPIRVVLVAMALAWGLDGFAANTYKWVDEQGNVHYSQRPPPSSNYEKLKLKVPSQGQTPAPTTAPAAGLNSGASNGNNAALKQELAKNQELRQKNCDIAKSNLQAYTVYKKVRMPDGSVKRLDDNERAQKIEEAKNAIKEFCD